MDEATRRQLLTDYVDVAMLRDVVERHAVTNVAGLRWLVRHLMANAATQFRTDRTLALGSLVVPAGTYTLWTLPTPSGWQLIVNRQTGQWGTDYDASQDLGRVPMTAATLPAPVEVFTIAVEPRGAGGILSLSWDRTRVQVPFTVR